MNRKSFPASFTRYDGFLISHQRNEFRLSICFLQRSFNRHNHLLLSSRISFHRPIGGADSLEMEQQKKNEK